MLCLSQTTGYAIKALTALAEHPSSCVQTADIARSAEVPRPYLAKIIQALARGGVVIPRRGIGGGVTLARPAKEISLLEVVEAVEGTEWLGSCLLGLNECTDMVTCPTHDFWKRVRAEIEQQLKQTSLASVIAFRALSRAEAANETRRGAGLRRRARGAVKRRTQGRN